MKLTTLMLLAMMYMPAWANGTKRTPNTNGTMWGNWYQGTRSFFINHQQSGPSFVWMTIDGTQLIFKGKVARLSGPDKIIQDSLFEIDGVADKNLPVVRNNLKCFIKKPVIGLIGLLSKKGRKLIYGGVGTIHGLLHCPGLPSRHVSVSLSGSWDRI